MDKIQFSSNLISKPSVGTNQNNPLLQASSMSTSSVVSTSASSKVSFGEHLHQAIQDVDMAHKISDKKLELLASGEDVDVHGTMIALQEADISLRTMTAFRDKMSEAYKNLINMAI